MIRKVYREKVVVGLWQIFPSPRLGTPTGYFRALDNLSWEGGRVDFFLVVVVVVVVVVVLREERRGAR